MLKATDLTAFFLGCAFCVHLLFLLRAHSGLKIEKLTNASVLCLSLVPLSPLPHGTPITTSQHPHVRIHVAASPAIETRPSGMWLWSFTSHPASSLRQRLECLSDSLFSTYKVCRKDSGMKYVRNNQRTPLAATTFPCSLQTSF